MKKILSSLLAGVMACVLAVACFACNAGDQSDNKTEYFNEYNMYLVYAASENITPLDYKTWLATVKGEKGDKGEDGKSAYQIWLDNGNTGSQADFLEWLKGEQGAPGKDGINGVDGKSAYETFKEYYPDYNGTEQEWITAVASGDKCALFGHSFDDGVVTIKPTIGKIGEKTYTCTVCNATKSEVVSKIDFTIGEVFELGEKVYVKFGSYPQTHVCESELIAELNKLTETNERGYYTYNGNEYTKIIAKPDNIGANYTYSDGVNLTSSIEWFLVESIKWRAIEEVDGSIKIVSDLILDSSCYYGNTDFREVDEKNIASNNYKYSTLRDFLNNNFYNAAFTAVQKSFILSTEVDNSAGTTGIYPNPFACENTSDKIFALSYSESFNSLYFANNAERQCRVTDYAKARGAYFGNGIYQDIGNWWLRSPCSDSSCDVSFANYDGYIDYASRIDRVNFGIVPAMQIRIA